MRPPVLNSWFTTVDALKGVGPAILSHLRRLLGAEEGEIPKVRDLALHLPMDVVDRRKDVDLSAVKEAQIVTLKLKIEEHSPPRRRNMPYRIAASDPTGEQVILVFFQGRPDYLTRTLPNGELRIISGRVERTSYGLQMVHPDAIVLPEEEATIRRLEPIYPLTGGLHARKLLQLIEQAIKRLQPLPEWQDEALKSQKNWPSLLEAVKRLHHPEETQDISDASIYYQRLVYDELLAMQLAMAIVRRRMRRPQSAFIVQGDELRQQALGQLPFQLTDGQQQVLQEIDADMASGKRMLRLLQGDVGSGKTVVALLAVLSVIEAGGQAALMVPTEILGRQHDKFIQPFMESLGLQAALLTGRTEPAERRRILAGVESGEIHLLIGTHALFQESVNFHRLGLAVIDEQHRFGVNQRLKLSEKGQGTHILLMTATPIPRSLAMTLYGDMDVSALMEKPAGRQPIATRIIPLTREEEILQAIRRALDSDEKIYWICPLVEGGGEESSELSAATERFREFQQRFGPVVGLAHGRMDGVERQEVMRRFAEGELRMLVATTVVEVGVDVPDATIMVIEHAERFGLAQLHQLRGRVGRGDKASSCLLLYGERISEQGQSRLKAMRESNDGFYLAEEDLRLRGGGDILGVKQSGLPQFRFADLARDRELVHTAQNDARHLIEKDPALESERGKALRALLYLFDKDRSIRFLQSG